MTDFTTPKSKRGFGSMDPARLKEVAAKGGASVKAENRSFSKSRELATQAGAKGGSSSRGGGRPAGSGR